MGPIMLKNLSIGTKLIEYTYEKEHHTKKQEYEIAVKNSIHYPNRVLIANTTNQFVHKYAEVTPRHSEWGGDQTFQPFSEVGTLNAYSGLLPYLRMVYNGLSPYIKVNILPATLPQRDSNLILHNKNKAIIHQPQLFKMFIPSELEIKDVPTITDRELIWLDYITYKKEEAMTALLDKLQKEVDKAHDHCLRFNDKGDGYKDTLSYGNYTPTNNLALNDVEFWKLQIYLINTRWAVTRFNVWLRNGIYSSRGSKVYSHTSDFINQTGWESNYEFTLLPIIPLREDTKVYPTGRLGEYSFIPISR